MNNQPTILILVGITGDLSKRKLLLALDGLKQKGLLPQQFKLVGVTRRDDPELFKMDLDNAADYERLKEYLESIEKEWGSTAQRLFYLSVAPTVSMPIIKLLGETELSNIAGTKLLVEKPFGTDSQSGQQIIADISKYFSDEQVYRVDHYLQKDSVRDLAAHTIDVSAIKTLEVFAREHIGIEGRGDFYEQTGALRDFVQSHLLEVAAMAINPHDRLEVLKQLYVDMEQVQRGQYKGYREAVGNPESVVETFVSVAVQSHDPALSELVIVLKTGKALDRKSTDITILYKDGATRVISLNDTHNAYENVFEDAMKGDKTFFVSKEEVLENWRIITPIQESWKTTNSDLIFYEQGATM